MARCENYDAIIMDVMLPDIDGFDVVRTLRGEGHRVPVIYLTARDRVEDVVEGLEAGGDDYLQKPFSFVELLARVRALIRRHYREDSGHVLIDGDLNMNLLTRTVTRNNVMLNLTNKEFELLEYFLRHPGQVMTRTMIAEHVWDIRFDFDSNLIDVHLARLRKKMEVNDGPRVIHTIKESGMFTALKNMISGRSGIRLALLYSSITTFFLLIMIGVTLVRVKKFFYADVASELIQQAKGIAVILEKDKAALNSVETVLNMLRNAQHDHIIDVVIKNEDGRVLFNSGLLNEKNVYLSGLGKNVLELTHRDVVFVELDDHRHRGLRLLFNVKVDGQRGYTCRILSYPRFITKNVTNIKYLLLWILLSVVPIFFVLGVFISYKTYLPFKKMIERANRIGASNLSLRLEGPGNRHELDQLADTFNRLFKRLQDAFQRERDFSSQVAHELRTPITALRGQIESLLLDDQIEISVRESLAKAIQATDRIVNLINQMLFLSRAERENGVDIKRERIPLKPLILEICELVFPEEMEQSRDIEILIPDGMRCHANHDMISRVFVNVIENIRNYTPKGTPVTIRGFEEGRDVVVDIQDRGEGISETERELVFDKFYTRRRGDRHAFRGGSGLGLSIARTIARLHGGDLTVRETPGGGCTFILRIEAA